ncbi:hypothetical protein [Cryobacterium algoritolerans]|uniref:hypothetical protein n=1 Tax=Cryobacterium algoritolerans TaxID=1259184 RepID=UPI001F5432C3|nr:hypothetical protein [Cryobacterium algoritolerans]
MTWGGLVRQQDGSYSLGMRLWEVGVQTPMARNLRTMALPYLEDLYYADDDGTGGAAASARRHPQPGGRADVGVNGGRIEFACGADPRPYRPRRRGRIDRDPQLARGGS